MLAERLRHVWQVVVSTVRDPTSNLTVAFFVMAIVTLALLLLLVLLYIVLTWREHGERERRRPAAADGVERRPWRHRRQAAAAAAALAALALVSAWDYSGRDGLCARCHHTSRAFETRAEGAHASVPCGRCHVGRGAAGALARIGGAGNAVNAALGASADVPMPSFVSDRACLACHRAVTEGTITARGVRIRHADISGAGYRCGDCHNTVAHGPRVRRAREPSMSSCVVCHDGEKASAACETCHVDDPGVAIRRLPRGFKKARIVKEDCRGCHSIESCNECHGLELPHSRRFVDGYHARQALDKETCLKCHDLYAFCNKGCHRFKAGLAAGPRVLGGQHGTRPRFVGWHSRYGPRRCAGCHDDPNVCRYCHERAETG
ncbi:MAG: cytochrome c3 family protein [Coriobacteriia bacterium]|nr:cytochrome c3 family protein [Coriobacteriia bacterium]